MNEENKIKNNALILLKVGHTPNDGRNQSITEFFAMSNDSYQQFLKKPDIIHSSLEIHSVYAVPSDRYKENPDHHSTCAKEAFNRYQNYKSSLIN